MGSMLCRDHFQRAVNPLKMNSALEDLQLKKWITMWRKCEPLCGQTVDPQFSRPAISYYSRDQSSDESKTRDVPVSH